MIYSVPSLPFSRFAKTNLSFSFGKYLNANIIDFGLTTEIQGYQFVNMQFQLISQNKYDYMRENGDIEREWMERERRDIYSRNFGSEMMTCLRANRECK